MHKNLEEMLVGVTVDESATAPVLAQKEGEVVGAGELGRAPKAAVLAVKAGL